VCQLEDQANPGIAARAHAQPVLDPAGIFAMRVEKPEPETTTLLSVSDD